MIYAQLEVTSQPGPSSDKIYHASEDRQPANGTADAADGKVTKLSHLTMGPLD